jgi:hypothetical protein
LSSQAHQTLKAPKSKRAKLAVKIIKAARICDGLRSRRHRPRLESFRPMGGIACAGPAARTGLRRHNTPVSTGRIIHDPLFSVFFAKNFSGKDRKRGNFAVSLAE